jgi:hypothetical protein
MRTQPSDERIARFLDDSFTLDHGGHPSFEAGHCATEAGAWLVGADHTDRPSCMSPIVAQFLRTLSDNSSHEVRQSLKRYVLRAIGTDHDGHDLERLETCRAWLIRSALPQALDLAGLEDIATRLRDEPHPATEEHAAGLLREARVEAWTARQRAYRSVPERPAVALAAAAAAAEAAAEAAAGAGAAAAAIYAEAVDYLEGCPADAGSYADASVVAASAAAGTYGDAAAAAEYTDPAPLLHPPMQPGQAARERLLEAARTRFKPLSEQLRGDALALLDQMLPQSRAKPRPAKQ